MPREIEGTPWDRKPAAKTIVIILSPDAMSPLLLFLVLPAVAITAGQWVHAITVSLEASVTGALEVAPSV
ncbi:MAG: hypothetical protein ACOC9Q_02325 [bacterium]